MKRTGLILALILTIAGATPAWADLLSDTANQLKQVQDQIVEQQKQLDAVRKRKATLQNQIDILDQQIKLSQLRLQAFADQITGVNQTMSQTNAELVADEVQIYDKKQGLREAVKEAYLQNRLGVIGVILGSRDLADFISQIEYLTTIEGRITNGISVLQTLNTDLAGKKQELEAADKQLKELQSSQQLEQNSLNVQQDSKQSLLHDTTLTEAEYQKKLEAEVRQQQALQNEVARLSANSQRGVLNQGKYSLIWPIASRTLTATFHDPDYYARFHLQHDAIDIATPQGTPIRAPADAYVIKVHFDGSTSYAYIILDHGNGMVTVYGHVSAVLVTTGQFVSAGTIIGLSGATPGSVGAGLLTTGPHLHFEVWLNGQARNPLEYLVG